MIAIAGTRAMNGLAIIATTPMPRIGLRQPLTAHARLTPVIVSATKRTRVVGFSRGALRTNAKTTRTKRNDAAFIAKQSPTDPRARARAASTGPTMRPKLNWAEESETAARTSSLSTRSGKSDCHADHDAELHSPSATAR